MFTGSWCQPCKRMKPTFEEIASQMEGNIRFAYMDAEDAKETMAELRANDQILFRYCDADGRVTPEANPNGTTDNIAGICNAGRNVFGMMPHPERAADGNLFNQDGLALFQSILARVEA